MDNAKYILRKSEVPDIVGMSFYIWWKKVIKPVYAQN